MFDKLLYYLVTFAEAVLSVFGLRGVYEQPDYRVLQDLGGGVEIREYGPRVAAEATVAADASGAAGGAASGDASGEAFKLLFAYIAGANAANSRVAMTAPVQQAAAPEGSAPERVAMTAPVQTARVAQDGAQGGALVMRFFLPQAVADRPPRPLDPRVQVVTLPAATIASLRFSGRLDAAAEAAQRRALADRLAATDWRPVGEPYLLSYDPPFTIPFLRRNEVAVEVAPR
jgi:hypothetical protein